MKHSPVQHRLITDPHPRLITVESSMVCETFFTRSYSFEIFYFVQSESQTEEFNHYLKLCSINQHRFRCRPLLGLDALRQMELALQPCDSSYRTTFNGYAACQRINQQCRTSQEYLSVSNILRSMIKSNRDILLDYQPILHQ